MDAKERVKIWRAEKTEQGWRNISISVDSETGKQIDELCRTLRLTKGGRNKPVIVAAIRHLHKSIFNE
jgi:hypothetical protein